MKARLFFVLALGVFSGSALTEESGWTTQRDLFVVSYQSELEPMQINKLHAWIIHIENADGQAVEGAIVEAAGGMPLHNHGLPTRPRMTAEIGGGDYRLDGMRFHMAGVWEITLLIRAGETEDTVVISLTL